MLPEKPELPIDDESISILNTSAIKILEQLGQFTPEEFKKKCCIVFSRLHIKFETSAWYFILIYYFNQLQTVCKLEALRSIFYDQVILMEPRKDSVNSVQ